MVEVKLAGTTYQLETDEAGKITKATVDGKIIPLSAMMPSVVNLLQIKVSSLKK